MAYSINELYRWIIALFSLIMLFGEFIIFSWLKNNKLNTFKLIFSLILSFIIVWFAIPGAAFTCDSYDYDWCSDYTFIGVATIISESSKEVYASYTILNKSYTCSVHHLENYLNNVKNNQFIAWRKSSGYTTCVINSYVNDYIDLKNSTNKTYMNLLLIFGFYIVISNLILLIYYQIYVPYFTTIYDNVDSEITENILTKDKDIKMREPITYTNIDENII